MISVFLLLKICSIGVLGYGYDAGSNQGACGKNYRQSRAFQPPCNLVEENYCTQAGNRYPWHAVKRFIRENQGLMRRMYGDQRHFSVIQEELDPNDIDIDQFNEINFRYRRFNNKENYMRDNSFQGRYLQDDFGENELYFVDGSDEEDESQGRAFPGESFNAKFVYSEEGEIVKAQVTEIKNIPMFRETSTTTIPSTTTSATTTTLKSTSTTSNTKVNERNVTESAINVESKSTGGSDVDGANKNSETTTETSNSTRKISLELVAIKLNGSSTTTSKTTTGEVLFFKDMTEQSTKKSTQTTKLNYENLKGVNACPVKEEVVAPFWANNTRGEALALLNLYPFEQYVHWEKCTFEHKQMYCREGCRCEQQYRLHKLLAYDPNNECKGIFSDWFKFPSCCVCKCYNIPSDFRVTSRSPRRKTKDLNLDSKELPEWIKSRAQND